MAKVRNNIFVRGLSGAIGDQFVIKTTRSGKTIIANMPTFDEDRVFSEAQMSHQSAFREASAYARSAKTQPVYVERANVTNSIPYNVAISDWFGKPQVLEIDIKGWTGEAGQPIRVRAQDNVHVAGVQVAIEDQDGGGFEEGEAVQAEGLWWTYLTTSAVPQAALQRVIAVARDLPGNTDSLMMVSGR
jgi:hypothetical protein